MAYAAEHDWYAWKERIGNAMYADSVPGDLTGLAVLEQWTLRSKKEHRCIECGEHGTVKQNSQLIHSVDHYWFCDDCDNYWQHKND